MADLALAGTDLKVVLSPLEAQAQTASAAGCWGLLAVWSLAQPAAASERVLQRGCFFGGVRRSAGGGAGGGGWGWACHARTHV
jgi:hypothetical protein